MTDSRDPEETDPTQPGSALSERFIPRRARPQWREEFPYHWSADDLVTRRDTLRFLVAGSGALFLTSAAMAIAGFRRPSVTRRVIPIATVDQVAENTAKVFTYPDQYAQGILINLPARGLVAFSAVCTHLSCAVLYQPEDQKLHCPCHEGYFDAYTGDVLAGPPTRPLPTIEIELRGDTVYAIQEEVR
jgi:Rieske Fe-S protein